MKKATSGSPKIHIQQKIFNPLIAATTPKLKLKIEIKTKAKKALSPRYRLLTAIFSLLFFSSASSPSSEVVKPQKNRAYHPHKNIGFLLFVPFFLPLLLLLLPTLAFFFFFFFFKWNFPIEPLLQLFYLFSFSCLHPLSNKQRC